MTFTFYAATFAFLLVASLLGSTFKITKEYERGVVFRLGRLIGLKGPGLFYIIPFGIDRLTKIDLRVITLEVPQQEVITSDNVTVKVNAVIFFQVIDAQAAIIKVYNFMEATSQIAQTTLRAVLGQSSLDELLGARDKINERLRGIIDRQTEPWGVKVLTVELKDAQLAESMVRALARQAEAEREKRAKSSPPKVSFRPRRYWPMRPKSSRRNPRRSLSGTCKRSWIWGRIRIRPSFFQSPSSSSARSWRRQCRCLRPPRITAPPRCRGKSPASMRPALAEQHDAQPGVSFAATAGTRT